MNAFARAQFLSAADAKPRTSFWAAWIAPFLLVPIALMGPHTGLALYACAVLGAGTSLLIRPGESPILLFVFLYQWVQSGIGLFYANLRGVPIDTLSEFHGQHEMAIFLLLTGILILAGAMRLTAGRPIRGLFPRARAFVAMRALRFWVWLFIGAWVFGTACESVAYMSGGLTQILLTLAQIKWAAFVLLTLATFSVPNRSKIPWIVTFCIQFALSLGGFFSNFKDVFIYALLGLLASNVRFRARLVVPIASLVCVLVFLGLIWTAIKRNYRDYVNQGSKQQVALVSYTDQIGEIFRLSADLKEEDIRKAADSMVKRLMYFEFFGVVLNRVPAVLPHAEGQIWLEAVRRPFMPRILFPEKTSVNDSELTNRYTGLGLAGAAEGASISLGYMAEAFIDFGPVFMFIPITALGLLLGAYYRQLLSQPGLSVALGVALAPFALMPALLTETSSIKLVPSLGLSMIACWIVLNVLAPRLFGLPRKTRRPRRNRLMSRLEA